MPEKFLKTDLTLPLCPFAPLPLWQLGVWYLHELFAVVWIPLSSNVTFNH